MKEKVEKQSYKQTQVQTKRNIRFEQKIQC